MVDHEQRVRRVAASESTREVTWLRERVRRVLEHVVGRDVPRLGAALVLDEDEHVVAPPDHLAERRQGLAGSPRPGVPRQPAALQHRHGVGRVDEVLEHEHDDLVGILAQEVVDEAELVDSGRGPELAVEVAQVDRALGVRGYTAEQREDALASPRARPPTSRPAPVPPRPRCGSRCGRGSARGRRSGGRRGTPARRSPAGPRCRPAGDANIETLRARRHRVVGAGQDDLIEAPVAELDVAVAAGIGHGRVGDVRCLQGPHEREAAEEHHHAGDGDRPGHADRQPPSRSLGRALRRLGSSPLSRAGRAARSRRR